MKYTENYHLPQWVKEDRMSYPPDTLCAEMMTNFGWNPSVTVSESPFPLYVPTA